MNELEQNIREARKIITRSNGKVRINGISMRQTMLNSNNAYFRKVYGIPEDVNLSFIENRRECVCMDGIPISQVLEYKINDEKFVDDLLAIIRRKRDRIIESQTNGTSPDEIMQLLWDYSSLRLDDLVNMDRVKDICGDDSRAYSALSVPASGITFFEMINIAELESYGHQILMSSPLTQKSFYFENKGFEHFVKTTSTRKKFLNIMFYNDEVREQLKQRYDSLPAIFNYKTPGEVYDAIADIRKKQMIHRCTRARFLPEVDKDHRNYMRFVGEAFDFNEQNRILRSVCLYNAMNRDPSIVTRFSSLIEERKYREIAN